ncbi:MAG: YncE family protein [Pedobacter sp.]|uniref:YncE family protein n=1 Tax=Pedobacter sp. TaxID=1411316 RepID=UPI003392386F
MKFQNNLLAVVLIGGTISARAQTPYAHDRVYTANQVSNTVSVVDPATNVFLGEISLGKPYPNVLSPLYRGQSLVHGLRYSPAKKMLAVVSIGSNSVTLVSTESNKVIKTIYVGRSPHEPTFTPDSKQIWTSVRGEAYVSVIDVASMKEIRKVQVADGPGMISFSPDGKIAYVCSSFSPELDIVNTSTYEIIKRIPVVSPFSPNIFTSPDGNWVAMTHKDVGKVTLIDTKSLSVHKVLTTGAITNHVTFSKIKGKLKMLVTVGGENKVRVFDVASDFKQTDTINVGNLPHGLWPSADGKLMYVGLEYGDQVQGIDLLTMKVLPAVKIGQSPQALVYADNAVTDARNHINLKPLNDAAATQIIQMKAVQEEIKATGKIAVRPIGLADLVEQIFGGLEPARGYTLFLSKSTDAPYTRDYEINSFDTDAKGKYMGQSTGLVKNAGAGQHEEDYKHLVLTDNQTGKVLLLGAN